VTTPEQIMTDRKLSVAEKRRRLELWALQNDMDASREYGRPAYDFLRRLVEP